MPGIRRLFSFFTLLFVALILNLTYWQVVAPKSLAEREGNNRKIEAELRTERGLILAGEVPLAQNNAEGDYFLRSYPQGSFAAHTLGYFDIRYGSAGIERSLSSILSGTSERLQVENFLARARGDRIRGGDVVLTLNQKTQNAAERALAGKQGAIVALDVKTGAVLALASSPAYDPNAVATQFETLQADPSSPLFNRATQALYTPGSSFKLITTAAALESGRFSADSEFDDTGTWQIYGNTIPNFAPIGGKPEVYARHKLRDAFTHSVNTTFGKVGNELGGPLLVEYAEKFGLNSVPPFKLPVKTSTLQKPGDMDPVDVVWSAIGQAEVQTTPLQMALVAQGIANRGEIMRPYVVERTLDYNGALLEQTQPQPWKRAISPQSAETMKQMMVDVVNKGTGQKAKTDKVQIAAKTGTAEVGPDRGPNAWFVGFAPAGDPKVAIAVIVENGDSGGGVSGPLARDVVLAALGQ